MGMKRLLCVLLVFCMVLTLAACGGSDKEAAEGDGMEVSVCFASEPTSIDPALNTTIDGAIMLQHAFEGLLKWVDDGNGAAVLAPGMAESWDVSPDGLVYTFHLRKDALWSDGEPVTAHDFEYAWKRLIDPATGAPYSYMLDCVANAGAIMTGEKPSSELAAKALDNTTFEVTLHTAIPYFTKIAAFPGTFPVRSDVIEEYGDQWTFDPETYVSNGPYKMTEWVHNSYIKMAQNENHYDAANIGPDFLRFALMDDNNAMLAAFNTGELDFNEGYPMDEAAALLESGQLKVEDYIGTCYINFRTDRAPFDDARIREAFSLVIDRNYIVEQITRTGQVAAGAYVPPGVGDASGANGDFRATGGMYYDVTAGGYAANCEKARNLLAEAGYADGAGFPAISYLYNTDDQNKMIAEALQNMWKTELGVSVSLLNQDWAVFLETRQNGDYFIANSNWIADYDDPINFLELFVSTGGNNDTGYASKDYDTMIAAAKSTTDETARMQLLHDAEDLLMADEVVAPLYFYTQPYMIADDLKGVYYTPYGYFFFGYAYKE